MAKLPFVYRTIGKGSVMHHVYQEKYGSVGFNGSGLGERRFDPIEDVNGKIIPSYYASYSVLVALAETVLRFDKKTGISTLDWSPDTPHTIANGARKGVAQVRPTRALKVIDMNTFVEQLTGESLSVLLGQGDNAYPDLHVYAAYLAVNYPRADGLIWDSYQRSTAGERAMMLFGDRVGQDDLECIGHSWIDEEHNRDHLRDTIRTLNIAIPAWLP